MNINEVKKDIDCKSLLFQINEEVFKCDSCGYDNYFLAKNFDKVCQKCKKRRSVTKGTIFENVRFGLHTAFKFLLEYSKDKNKTTRYFVEKFKLSEKTAYNFKKKLIDNKTLSDDPKKRDELVRKLLNEDYSTSSQLKEKIKDSKAFKKEFLKKYKGLNIN